MWQAVQPSSSTSPEAALRWSEQVESVTGIAAWDRVETDLILDLARVVAHGTERRFAPLTAYAMGVAVGQQLGAEADQAEARQDALRALVVALTEAVEDQAPGGDEQRGGGEPSAT